MQRCHLLRIRNIPCSLSSLACHIQMAVGCHIQMAVRSHSIHLNINMCIHVCMYICIDILCIFIGVYVGSQKKEITDNSAKVLKLYILAYTCIIYNNALVRSFCWPLPQHGFYRFWQKTQKFSMVKMKLQQKKVFERKLSHQNYIPVLF